jgi:hypothetical protein
MARMADSLCATLQSGALFHCLCTLREAVDRLFLPLLHCPLSERYVRLF